MAHHRLVLALAAASVALAGCAGSDEQVASPPAPTSTPSTSEPAPSGTPEPPVERVVVGRPTDPQLDLTAAQARRIVANGLTRWRGRPVSVVPLDEVGPTQVVARVGWCRPRPRQSTRARPDRRGRRDAHPWGDRPGRGPGADVEPAPSCGHHRRQPREHAVAARVPDAGQRLVRGHAGAARAVAAGRLRRAVAGQQPHRRLRPAGAARHGGSPAAQPDQAVRRGPSRDGCPAGGRREGRRAIRVPRLQRHRRDTAGGGQHPRCAVGADAAAHGAAGAVGPRDGARGRPSRVPERRRGGGPAALGHAVHPCARARAAPGRPQPGARRCRPGRRRSSALGAGRRHGARCAGAALARQLRLRHGLHGADDAGRRLAGHVLGPGAEGGPARRPT